MKRNRKYMISLAVGLVAAFSINGQDSLKVHEFTAQQAVAYANANNLQVKNALVAVQIQNQVNRDVTSAAYPQLSGNASFADNIDIPTSLIPGDFFGQPGTFVPLKFGVKYNATAGVELNQILFDGQVFVGLQARTTVMDWARKNVEVTGEMIKANVYKVYYQLVASKTQVELLDANEVRLEKLLSDTREIYKNGFAEKLDITKLEVQLANLKTDKLKTVTTIENGYLGLKLLMGMPIRDSLVLTDSIRYENIKEDILTTTPYDYNDRKEFQYALLSQKLNEYNIKRYKLSRWPTLSLNAYYNRNAQRTAFDFFEGGQWFKNSAFSIRLDVPIFNGFSTRAKIDKAQFELIQTQNQIENLKLTIDHDVALARANFRTAVATIEVQKKNMELAEQVYEQTKTKFEAGVGSNIEINGAQVDLRAAQTNYISALYDAIIARVNYLSAVGKL